MTLAAETDFGRKARDLPRKPLPLIDVGPALTGDRDAIEALATKWRDIWEGVGFTGIINHGVPLTLTRRMPEEAKRFQNLP
jgi:isopenicillin N synthase-like dioxygenase